MMKYSQSNPQLANMFPDFQTVYLQNGLLLLLLPVTWTVCHTNSELWRSWGPVWL